MAFTSVKQSDSRAEDVETDFANPSINMPEEFLHTQATEASLSKALKDRLDLANARAACTTNSAFGSCWRKMKVFLAFQMCHRRAEINSRSGKASALSIIAINQRSIRCTPVNEYVMLIAE